MSTLREYYDQKYGKTAAARPPEQIASFRDGKTAGAAFMDELQKLNEKTAAEIKKEQEAKS